MTRLRALLLVAVGSLTALLVLLLTVPSASAGPVLVDAFDHGLHRRDLPAVGLWVLGIGACALAWRRS